MCTVNREKLPEAVKYYCPKLNDIPYVSFHCAAKPLAMVKIKRMLQET